MIGFGISAAISFVLIVWSFLVLVGALPRTEHYDRFWADGFAACVAFFIAGCIAEGLGL